MAKKSASMEEADVRFRWRVSVLAAAGAALLLAGCGVRVVADPSVSPRSAPSSTAEGAVTLTGSASPLTGASPPPPCPAPPPAAAVSPPPAAPPPRAPGPAGPCGPQASERRAEALEAAALRVAAAAEVRDAVPVFDQLATGMVERSRVPGVAVAVIAGDTVMYERCFGLREVGRPEPVDDESLFPLGAVSRAYTTTMLAALAGDGELSWDQPVRSVWPGFTLRDRWATREATFRDLTCGRAGLPAYAGSELRAFGYDRAEILRRLRYLRPAAGFRAGYAPQDALVTAAAVAAERATGVSWARLVRERVLEIMGDEETVLTRRGFVRAADRVSPHTLVGASMVPQDPPDEAVFAPSLGVSASLHGLETFVRLQLNGGALGGVRVAPAGLLAQTLQPTACSGATRSGPQASGLGWMVSSFNGRLLASAEGGLASGSSAVVTLAPADGVAVIVLANAHPEGMALGRAMVRMLLDLVVFGAPQEDWLAREQESCAAGEAAGSGAGLPLPSQAPEAAPAPHPRAIYSGAYRDRYYGRITVSRGAGDGLEIRLGRGDVLRYVPWSGDVWRETASGTAAVFDVHHGRAKAVTLTLLTFDGRCGVFTRAG